MRQILLICCKLHHIRMLSQQFSLFSVNFLLIVFFVFFFIFSRFFLFFLTFGVFPPFFSNFKSIFPNQVGSAILLGLGIWTLADRSFMNELLGTNLFSGTVYVLIGTAAFVCVISFFGCYGAAKEVKSLLLFVSAKKKNYSKFLHQITHSNLIAIIF